MEKTKDELISDLYALRGGLSVISKHIDEIRKRDSSITHLSEKLKETERNYNYYKMVLAEEQRELDRLYQNKKTDETYIQSKKTEVLNQNKQAQDNIKGHADKCKRRMFVFIIITIISIISSVVLLTLSNHLDIFEGGDICGGLGGFLAGLAVIFLIISIVFMVQFIKANKLTHIFVPMHYNTGNVENQLLITNKNINQHESRLKDLKRDCNDAQAAIQIYKDSIENFTKEKEETSSEVSVICQNIKQALNITYDSWLSESDWQNVDLLIYYLETGRADTLKEALAMVDRQLQTNQIVDAISVASNSICERIDSSMRKLGNALTQSFTVLSKQLSDISGKMDRVIDITEQNAERYEKMQTQQNLLISETNDKIIQLQSAQLTANEMNKALLEKANRSSEELMNDLRYGQRYWIK